MQFRQRFIASVKHFKIGGCASKKKPANAAASYSSTSSNATPVNMGNGNKMPGDVPVRPPMWDPSGKNPYRLPIEAFLKQQEETLGMFKMLEDKGNALHSHHFDWWMFPIDDGSRPEFNVKGESDVEEFRSNEQMMKNLNESWRRACHAWGWDFEGKKRLDPMPPGCGWTDWDVRLSKMIRCAWLFENQDALDSLQAFARDLQANEKRGQSFYYGHICLDEILAMKLPRK
mgnify:CR=1 FL=1